LTFSKLYLEYFSDCRNRLLIVPCGYGGTGFIDNRWNEGDDLYEDAVSKVNYLLKSLPGSNLKVILWHQGEDDVDNPGYKDMLDSFINDFRQDLNNPEVPFILGGMVPYWVNIDSTRINQQEIIANTPERIFKTGYADPSVPYIIEKEDNEFDMIHYDAKGQRELGRRYFDAYLKLLEYWNIGLLELAPI